MVYLILKVKFRHHCSRGLGIGWSNIKRAPSSEFGTYRLCEQQRFRRACASAQSRQNLRCSLIQAVSQEEPSDRKQDPWPLWMAGHAQLKFVMTECSKTQIRLTGLKRVMITSESVGSVVRNRFRLNRVYHNAVFRRYRFRFDVVCSVVR